MLIERMKVELHRILQGLIKKYLDWFCDTNSTQLTLVMDWYTSACPHFFQGLFHLLLDAPRVLCYGGLEKLLYDIKFDHFHILKSLTFQGVLNLEDKEKVTLVHVWDVWRLVLLWSVVFG